MDGFQDRRAYVMPFSMNPAIPTSRVDVNQKLLNALCNIVDVHLKDLAYKHLEAVARGDPMFQLFKPSCPPDTMYEVQSCGKPAETATCSVPTSSAHSHGEETTLKSADTGTVSHPATSSSTSSLDDSQTCCYSTPRPVFAENQRTAVMRAAKRKRAVVKSCEEPQRPARVVKQRTSTPAVISKPGGTSSFRGVSWHEQTAKWKAQIKVNGCDVNLGRHKDEEEAARAYDRAAVCARGLQHAKLNFPISDYEDELDELVSSSLPDLAAKLRGVEERLQQQTSRYHGVRLNKRTTKWEAYIRISGKHIHLGCYQNECEAAQAFDQAAVVRMMCRPQAKHTLATNFPANCYKAFLAKLGKPTTRMEIPELPSTCSEEAALAGDFELPKKYLKVLLARCKEEATGKCAA